MSNYHIEPVRCIGDHGAAAVRKASNSAATKPSTSDKENIMFVGMESFTETQRDTIVLALEAKYDADGCNTADVVLARQENDAAMRRIAKQEAKLAEQAARNDALMRELASLKAQGNPITGSATDNGEEDSSQISDELAAERAKNGDLQRQLAEFHHAMDVDSEPRNLRDLVLQSGMNRDDEWADITPRKKAELFDVARSVGRQSRHVAAVKASSKKAAKKAKAAADSTKKAGPSKSTSKAQGKKKAVSKRKVVEDSDDEDEEDADTGGENTEEEDEN
ncbi:hypothetical protein R3P38DRAFT_2804292 [Favolaschia claudopus]|uniref:Uncharacterized protein n=1 Tax=Favolaschia claudopus TaxID=2862362 RepID=A0AAV9ZR75_9AGAR